MCRILAMRKHCGPKNPIGRTTGASRAPPSWLVSIRTTAAESATDHVRKQQPAAAPATFEIVPGFIGEQ